MASDPGEPDGPWLSVVGALPDGTITDPAARARINAAQMVFGARRLLEAAGVPAERCSPWPSPLSEGLAAIARRRGQPTGVLASGDPMHHGVGGTLSRRMDPAEMAVIPAPSAFSLAAARMRWPVEDALCLSLHDRPVETLNPHLADGQRIITLTRDGDTAGAVAGYLKAAGFGASTITVLEAMAGPEERIRTFRADEPIPELHRLNTLAIACAAAPDHWDPDGPFGRRTPGLPDTTFQHDGQLTKADVRAVTVAALAPRPGAHLWDIGAGSAAVAIEWCRAALGASAAAFERDAARAAMAHANASALGAVAVEVITGDAADHLADAARSRRPDAVFLGGVVAERALFDAAWDALLPGGIFVSNAVTLAGEAASIDRQTRYGGSLRRIAIEIAEPVGGHLALRPRLPIVQWRARKDQP